MSLLKFVILLAICITQVDSFSQPCTPGGYPCTAVIPYQNLPQIQMQQTMVWCWVASAQAIFRYYGYDVDQQDIVTSTFGAPIITTANALMMINMLNKKYIDKNGKKFTVRTPKIFDGFSWLSNNPMYMQNLGAAVLNNNDIRDAISSNRVIMFGTSNHAMVLTGMSYFELNGVVYPQSGFVLDPAPNPLFPGYPIGLRQLNPNEMSAFFCADVIITAGW